MQTQHTKWCAFILIFIYALDQASRLQISCLLWSIKLINITQNSRGSLSLYISNTKITMSTKNKVWFSIRVNWPGIKITSTFRADCSLSLQCTLSALDKCFIHIYMFYVSYFIHLGPHLWSEGNSLSRGYQGLVPVAINVYTLHGCLTLGTEVMKKRWRFSGVKGHKAISDESEQLVVTAETKNIVLDFPHFTTGQQFTLT